MTTCQISRNNAVERFSQIIAGKKDPNLTSRAEATDDTTTEEHARTDVEQIARDQILEHMEANLKATTYPASWTPFSRRKDT